MAITKQDSYEHCRRQTREAGSSFALGMRLFPPDRRDAVYALYAFFRRTDDLVDRASDPETGAARLAEWRRTVEQALSGGAVEADRCLLAVVDAARRHQLPTRLFLDCIDACATDLGPVRMDSWADLYQYCDGVAGTVGEACLRILGYHGDAVLELSRPNARAVQLTNILRDFDEDLAQDRVYLPRPVLERHGLDPARLRPADRPAAVLAALHEVADHARDLYERADGMFFQLKPRHRPSIVAMTLRYRRLLERLRQSDFQLPRGAAAAQAMALFYAAQLSRWKPTWRVA